MTIKTRMLNDILPFIKVKKSGSLFDSLENLVASSKELIFRLKLTIGLMLGLDAVKW